jgi:hypothetical protein
MSLLDKSPGWFGQKNAPPPDAFILTQADKTDRGWAIEVRAWHDGSRLRMAVRAIHVLERLGDGETLAEGRHSVRDVGVVFAFPQRMMELVPEEIGSQGRSWRLN